MFRDGKRYQVAAAIPEDTVVRLQQVEGMGDDFNMKIHDIVNSSPRPGILTWFDIQGFGYEIPASEEIQVVRYPE